MLVIRAVARRTLLALGLLILLMSRSSAAPLETLPTSELDRPRSAGALHEALHLALSEGTGLLPATRWLSAHGYSIFEEVYDSEHVTLVVVISRKQGALPMQAEEFFVMLAFDKGHQLRRICVITIGNLIRVHGGI